MKPKVLILTASYGSGHIMAAKALDEAFRQKKIEPVIFDCVLEGGKLEKSAAVFYEFLMKHGHFVWKIYHEKVMPIRKGNSIRKIYEVLHKGKFFKDIKKIDPDIIVSTMDTTSIIASLYKRDNPNVNINTVITDYVTHPLWKWENMDKYFVASELLKEDLIMQNIKKDKIFVTGIPIRHQFGNNLSKAQARKKLDIPEDKTVFLISAGTYSSVPIEKIIEVLSLNIHSYALIIAGKSRSKLIEYANLLKSYGVIGRVVSFTNEMHTFMRASDIFISKAGGLTVAECFACSLPAIYLKNFPGHEVGNALYCQSVGAGVIIRKEEELKNSIIDIFQNLEKLKYMQRNAKENAKAHAAEEIVEIILNETKN